jgi:hypothetical protein
LFLLEQIEPSENMIMAWAEFRRAGSVAEAAGAGRCFVHHALSLLGQKSCNPWDKVPRDFWEHPKRYSKSGCGPYVLEPAEPGEDIAPFAGWLPPVEAAAPEGEDDAGADGGTDPLLH